MNRIFTSESVTEGHPDKVCDRISDAVLDEILSKDKNARVACETMATTGMILVSGQISAKCTVDIPKIVRETVQKIGYSSSEHGFDYKNCAVLTAIDKQSPDIAMGVDKSFELRENAAGNVLQDSMGAGDQGLMFGFACDETPVFMPAPIYYSHLLTKRLAHVRKNSECPFLFPDGKAQVSVEYNGKGEPARISAVVLSAQHSSDISVEQLREELKKHVIDAVLPQNLVDKNTEIFINPTGRFVVGGPSGDVGLTGRKIIVDTYGGYVPHGGGAFSGKDPSKVDRSAAYMARYAAKNIVAAGLAKRCLVQVAYAIGVAKPMSIFADTAGTGIVSDEEITKIISDNFDFRPAAMIEKLNLRAPIYEQISAYGHFGRDDLDLSWEKTDIADRLRKI